MKQFSHRHGRRFLRLLSSNESTFPQIKMFDLIKDIYLPDNFIKTVVPFTKFSMDKLIRTRDYHSQCTLEIYLILQTLELSKDIFVTKPIIEELFDCALLNQRTTEYALICAQFETGLIGMKMDDPIKIYNFYVIISGTLNCMLKYSQHPQPQTPILCNRGTPSSQLAQECQKLVEKIFMILSDEDMNSRMDKKIINPRLCLCNQNMNELYVILI